MTTDAEAQVAAEKAWAIWDAMSEDDRRGFLRSRIAANPPADTELADAYIEYVATVSPDWMAMSFASAVFLTGLCVDRSPSLIADFGSGFSSYVLRRYAARSGAQVVSVDDSPEWLDRTRAFLDSYGLNTDELLTWDAWLDDQESYRFDLAFHDMASGQLRESSMGIIADRMNVGGVLVFDDAQHGGHFEAMGRVAAAHGWALRCLPETLDGNGRFEALCVCRAMSE